MTKGNTTNYRGYQIFENPQTNNLDILFHGEVIDHVEGSIEWAYAIIDGWLNTR